MAGLAVSRRSFRLSPHASAWDGGRRLFASANRGLQSHSDEQTVGDNGNGNRGKWLTLPPFDGKADGAALGREVAAQSSGTVSEGTTAFKWVTRCCPELPRSLVQKLFRLRQIRRELSSMDQSDSGIQTQDIQLKRVAAKDPMNLGDRVCLPITVKEFPSRKEKSQDNHFSMEEVNFVRSLELYKDSSIIAINKPPGMPVQGGKGIRRSLDELAVSCLKYDYPEPPRLVHRLDRDCSGILVMGRTRTSAAFLHSIFREKTMGASSDDTKKKRRILQRRYLALVIGSPKSFKGFNISTTEKVKRLLRPFQILVDDGKSERITVTDNSQSQTITSQHAITEYQVIDSCNGYTWLELSPLTGRKHQLRVHCAEVLGTPIVGDYKYGWRAHKEWETCLLQKEGGSSERVRRKAKAIPFGIDLESGSISDNQPRLHLHCKQIHLPDLTQALLNAESSSRINLWELDSLDLFAPLPSYMQRSLDVLRSRC